MNGPLPISINFPFRSSKRQEFQVRFRSCKHRDIKEEANFLVTFKSFHRLLGAFRVGILKVELKILKYLILLSLHGVLHEREWFDGFVITGPLASLSPFTVKLLDKES